MNRIALWILAQIIFLISAQAVPPVLNFAGQVAVNGEAFDGNGLFKFALVNADGTTTYWSNDSTSVDGSEPQASVTVPVNGGLYAVLLGNTAQLGMGAIDPAVFAQHTDAKLRVWFSDGVNGFQQLSPDRPFASVPYAFSAGTAQTAGSAPIAAGSINRSMLSGDIISDLNRTISHNDLSPQIKADINATIGLDRLSSEIISKLEQNATITNGSVTGSKIASKAIGKDQISDSILKYLKPEIISEPQSSTIYAGGDGTVSFSAEGKYLSYQWKKDGVDLAGETNATFNITDANASRHEGNYSVVVSNDFGSVDSDFIEILINNTGPLDGLLGWWKFDDGSGTVANDSSGNGNHGNLTNGPIWTTGKIGGALSFDGVDDKVVTNNFLGIGGANPRSISAWIKTTSLNAVICSWGTMAPTEKWVFRVQNTAGVSGAIRTEIFNGVKVGSLPVNNGTWFFVSSILHPNTTNISHLLHYVNGNLESASFNDSSVVNTTLSSKFKIGKGLDGDNYLSSSPFHGVIDDVRIYDRALSAAEVQALYNLGQ